MGAVDNKFMNYVSSRPDDLNKDEKTILRETNEEFERYVYKDESRDSLGLVIDNFGIISLNLLFTFTKFNSYNNIFLIHFI